MGRPTAYKSRKKKNLRLRTFRAVAVWSEGFRSSCIIRITFNLASGCKNKFPAVQNKNILFFCNKNCIYNRNTAQFTHSHYAAVNRFRTFAKRCDTRKKLFKLNKVRLDFCHCRSSVKPFHRSMKLGTNLFMSFSYAVYEICRKRTRNTAVNSSLKSIRNSGNGRNNYADSVSFCPAKHNFHRIKHSAGRSHRSTTKFQSKHTNLTTF